MRDTLFGRWGPLTRGGLRHNQTAIDIDGLPGEIARVVGGEEGHQPGHVFRFTGAFHRNALDPLGHQFALAVALLLGAENFAPHAIVVIPHFAFNNARAEGVDGDIPRRQLVSQALGNADHAHFAGGIMRRVDKALSPWPEEVLIRLP